MTNSVQRMNQHQKSLLFRLAALYILGMILFALLTSVRVSVWLGSSIIQSVGAPDFPLYLLGILLIGFGYMYRHQFTEQQSALPSQKQQTWAAVALVMTMLLSFVLTHPPTPFILLLTGFIKQNPEIRGTAVSATVYLVALLPIIPLAFCLFSQQFLKQFRTILLAISALLAMFLYANVIEAKYHQITAPATLQITHFLLSIVPGETMVDYATTRISYRYFEVTVGPVCSGLTMLTLFIGMFTFIYYQLHKNRSVLHIRAICALVAGIVFIFFLNALRIALIMLIGSVNPEFGIGLFHSSIGAILFFVLFVLYLKYIVPLIKRT